MIAIYNKTRIDDLKSAVRRINYVGGNVAGVVVNRTKVILSQYNTKYFYGNTIEVNNKSLRMKIKRFFYNQKVKPVTYNTAVIGKKENLDMNAISKLGEFTEVSLEEIFGY